MCVGSPLAGCSVVWTGGVGSPISVPPWREVIPAGDRQGYSQHDVTDSTNRSPSCKMEHRTNSTVVIVATMRKMGIAQCPFGGQHKLGMRTQAGKLRGGI